MAVDIVDPFLVKWVDPNQRKRRFTSKTQSTNYPLKVSKKVLGHRNFLEFYE